MSGPVWWRRHGRECGLRSPPRVLIQEVGKEEVENRVEVVQAASPFAVGGVPGGNEGAASAAGTVDFPELTPARSPFPKGKG